MPFEEGGGYYFLSTRSLPFFCVSQCNTFCSFAKGTICFPASFFRQIPLFVLPRPFRKGGKTNNKRLRRRRRSLCRRGRRDRVGGSRQKPKQRRRRRRRRRLSTASLLISRGKERKFEGLQRRGRKEGRGEGKKGGRPPFKEEKLLLLHYCALLLRFSFGLRFWAVVEKKGGRAG